MKKNPSLRALPKRQALRFTPSAWAKLLYLRDGGPNEIGGFAITSSEHPLLVEDIALVLQTCTATHVEFDDASVADFFDDQVDGGRVPESFARIWVHTHPGSSPAPSHTDEETFSRVFGDCQWAVMFILARGGESYARLRFNVGPGADVLLPVEVDFTRPFEGSEEDVWQVEFETCVRERQVELPTGRLAASVSNVARDAAHDVGRDAWYDAWDDYVHQYHSIPETSHVDFDDF